LISRNFSSLNGDLDKALQFGFFEVYRKRKFTTEATTGKENVFLNEPSTINRVISKIIRQINLL